jgi:hypothetical protein
MEFGFFNNLIENLEDVAEALKKDTQSFNKDNEKTFDVLEDFYCLANTTLNIIMFRLTYMIKNCRDDNLVNEFARLNKAGEWLKLQNNFKFCAAITKMRSDPADTTKEKAQTPDSQKWNEYLVKVNEVFSDEDALAMFIAGKFSVFFSSATSRGLDTGTADSVKKMVSDLKSTLKDERRRLVLQESRFISYIS